MKNTKIDKYSDEEATDPLFLEEVFEIISKRQKANKTNKENFFVSTTPNSVLLEKNKEYTEKFSSCIINTSCYLRNQIEKYCEKNFKERKEKFLSKFILCKVIDLNPKTYEEACNYIPTFRELFGEKDSKKIYNEIISILESNSMMEQT